MRKTATRVRDPLHVESTPAKTTRLVNEGKHLNSPHSRKTTQTASVNHSGNRFVRQKEPQDLYRSSDSFRPLPRWPEECEVLQEKIHHIDWSPPVPEPMYQATGQEKEPPCAGPKAGRVVYLSSKGDKEPCYKNFKAGGSLPVTDVIPESCRDLGNTLAFEARFESGNLQKVVQTGEFDYQMTLRSDLYSDCHIQWFYFRVRNTRAGVPYRFTIVNFRKPTSLFNEGMRPLMYSDIEAETRRIGWHRVGEEIKYYRNSQSWNSGYSLSWTFKFPHDMDTCYFAYGYPYTYSNLQDYVSGIANDPKKKKYCDVRVLCRSLAGNMVYELTITNPTTTATESKKKKAVIVTARVHPGETNSSWVMKGFLDFILSSHKDARCLRDTFVFKVVPMLNPDGVIVGNHRLSLAGRDLNRVYKSKLKESFPSIWFTRNMIQRVKDERKVLLYCDLHGHSRKQNAFMYGCSTKQGQSATMWDNVGERVFPLMLAKNCPEKFSYAGCKFKVKKSKEGTGRVVVWRLGVQNSYTLESTYCGSTLGKRSGTHFSTKDLESVGRQLCATLLDYCDLKKRTEAEDILRQSKRRGDSSIRSYLNLSDLDESSDGADSSDSDEAPDLQGPAKVTSKQKVLKTVTERSSSKDTKQCLQDKDDTVKTRKLITVDEGLSTFTKPTGPSQRLYTQQSMSQTAKTPLPKVQSGLSHQDPSRKKVSVVNLVFDAEREVRRTKELPRVATSKAGMAINGRNQILSAQRRQTKLPEIRSPVVWR